MKKIILICFVIFSTNIFPQKLSDSALHNLLLKGIDETMLQKYADAKATFTFVMQKYPDHPSGYLYLAGVLQAEFSDYGQLFNKNRYDSLLRQAQLRSEKMMENNINDWGNYYAGSALACRSFTYVEGGNLPLGLLYAIEAASKLENSLEANPNFYAAMNILGAYYYWRSSMSWMPLIKNRKEEGIALIKTAIQQNEYERILGKNNLIVIFIEEKRYDEAIYYAKEVLLEYPENRSILWMLMTAYEQKKDEKELSLLVPKLLKNIISAPVINYYKEATCRIKLAEYAVRDKNYSIALEEANKVLQFKKYIGKVTGNLSKKIRIAESIAKNAKLKLL